MQPHRSFWLFVYTRHGTFYLYGSNVNKTAHLLSQGNTLFRESFNLLHRLA